MSDVFQKYDGLNGETHAVDYLQTQVSCITSVCLLRKWRIVSMYSLILFYICSWSAVECRTTQIGQQHRGTASITTPYHNPAVKPMLHNVVAFSVNQNSWTHRYEQSYFCALIFRWASRSFICCAAFLNFVFFLQACESKLEQMLQDVLSYAMLVILGFAIIKVYRGLPLCCFLQPTLNFTNSSCFLSFSVVWHVQHLCHHL